MLLLSLAADTTPGATAAAAAAYSTTHATTISAATPWNVPSTVPEAGRCLHVAVHVLRPPPDVYV